PARRRSSRAVARGHQACAKSSQSAPCLGQEVFRGFQLTPKPARWVNHGAPPLRGFHHRAAAEKRLSGYLPFLRGCGPQATVAPRYDPNGAVVHRSHFWDSIDLIRAAPRFAFVEEADLRRAIAKMKRIRVGGDRIIVRTPRGVLPACQMTALENAQLA